MKIGKLLFEISLVQRIGDGIVAKEDASANVLGTKSQGEGCVAGMIEKVDRKVMHGVESFHELWCSDVNQKRL